MTARTATPEAEQRERFLHLVGREAATQEEKLTAFATAILKSVETDEDPGYNFEWAAGPSEAAARLKVCRLVAAIYEHADREGGVASHDERVARVREYAAEQAAKGARYPARSTSPFHNAYAQDLTAAWAEAVEKLDGWWRV